MQTIFVSSVKTSGIRIRITGYSFRKALETEKKNMLESFYIRGKRQHMFFVLIDRFRQFGAENFFINSFSIFFKVVKNHLKREKNHFFPLPSRIPPGSGSRSAKKMRIRNPVFFPDTKSCS